MSSDSVIAIIPPYATLSPENLSCHKSLLENDILFHLRTSFENYNQVKYFEPEWKTNPAFVMHPELGKCISEEFFHLELDLDSLNKVYEEAKRDSDTIHFLFIWNTFPNSISYTQQILQKIFSYKIKSKNVKIVSLIPDSWPRNNQIIDILQEHTKVCDTTIVGYESIIPALIKHGRKDIADKLTYVPTIFPFLLNKNAKKEKETDFCFIGRIDGFYANRGRALKKIFNAFPENNFFVHTDGKTVNSQKVISKQGQHLSKMKDYLNKIGESQYSIVTSTRSGNQITELVKSFSVFEEKEYEWSSVFPARFIESIINLTIPIFVQFSDDDKVPKIFDGMNAWIYVNVNDSPETIKEKIESVSIEDIIKNMLKLYEKFVSPESVIPIILGKKHEF